MLVDTEKDGGYTIEIHTDEDAGNPRKEWDNAGTMLCMHSRYDLGDERNVTVEAIQEIIEREDVLYLPLYLYDHSGITMRTGPFSCPWDSGQVGIIYITKERAIQEFGGKRFTETVKKQALSCLESEVKVYDAFLTGSVYGYNVLDPAGESIDSCWGFYETNNEDMAYMLSQAKAAIQHDREKRAKARAQRRADSAERRIRDTMAQGMVGAV